ncbi:MAG: hypothetical protein HC787_10095 [Nostocaceae cyanobacterium CSU_2_110]|nr:hypothetical protein [Nostocaceae cyanobacterium CSU_2_110]
MSALAVSSILVVTANYFDSFFVEFFAVLLMAVVGAESAVAISILILASNQGLDLNSYSLSSLKGLNFANNMYTLIIFGPIFIFLLSIPLGRLWADFIHLLLFQFQLCFLFFFHLMQ